MKFVGWIALLVVLSLLVLGCYATATRARYMKNQWPEGAVVTHVHGDVGVVVGIDLSEVKVRFGIGEARWYLPFELRPVRQLKLDDPPAVEAGP